MVVAGHLVRSRPQLVAFEGLDRPVAFHDGTDDLLPLLAGIAPGWPGHHLPASAADGAQVVVRRSGDDYHITTPWLDAPVIEPSAFRAAGNLAVDLIESLVARHPGRLTLHCGAAVFGDRLVVFPGHGRAGKSTLIGRLAADGLPVFTDDVLPLGEDDREGIALGIAPRLRLPLPACASPAFRAFVARHAGAGDDGYRYLSLPMPTHSPFGSRCRLGAVVLLDRQPDGPAELQPAAPGDGLEALILQNLATGEPLPRIVTRMRRLIEGLPCHRLRYADLDDATRALKDHFSAPSAFAVKAPAPRPGSPGASGPALRQTAGDGRLWRRDPAVEQHGVGDGAFLVDTRTEAVLRLDPVARGVWTLLEHPTAPGEAAALLAEAFPDIPLARIAGDVQRLFDDLEHAGLIRPALLTG